ncbi:N-acetylmuramoyl-L-alanine amidase [Candidatus Dojkabacteria bacterium]|nr:N-acetylmuramoyl-L-alanine amidase [Candidatus Dojkabacteria bacterium]
MARVIVSAGHTNNDPGVIIGNLREVDLNRAIAKKLVAQLRANGIITLSVPPNMDLQKRIDWINGTGYKAEFDDISIEIHINDGNKSGFEFWYEGDGNNPSQKLAEMIMVNVTERTKLPNQGVKSENEHKYKSLAFINKTNTTAVLLECLYIDNKDDAEKLKSETELDSVAKAIAEGICKYLNIEYIEAESPKSNVQNTQINSTQKPTNSFQENIEENQKPQANPAKPQQIQRTTNGNFPPSSMDDSKQDFESYNSNNGSTGQSGFSLPNQTQMSREERKELIIRMYNKILGREPNQNDLNYFINIGITEDKLIKRMIDSQEHLDLVNSKIDYEQNKEIYEKQKIELSRLKAENNDQKVLLNNLSKLLHQKNRHIGEMKARLDKIDPDRGFKTVVQADEVKEKYKGKLSDRVFHFLSTFLG